MCTSPTAAHPPIAARSSPHRSACPPGTSTCLCLVDGRQGGAPCSQNPSTEVASPLAALSRTASTQAFRCVSSREQRVESMCRGDHTFGMRVESMCRGDHMFGMRVESMCRGDHMFGMRRQPSARANERVLATAGGESLVPSGGVWEGGPLDAPSCISHHSPSS